MTDMTDTAHDQNPDSPYYPDPAQTARLRARLVSRVAESPSGGLVAAALRRLQEADGISPAEMAARLGTDAAGMNRLALCRMPRADRFVEDTSTIADYCGCAVSALLSLLRQADILATFAEPVLSAAPQTETAPEKEKQAGWWGVGALVAARDADDADDADDAAGGGDE